MADEKLFLCKIQLTRPAILTEGPTPAEAHIIDQHFNFLKSLTEQGIVLMAGRTLNTDPGTFGITILRAESFEHAHEIIERDPGLQSGTWRAELYPFRIALLGELEQEKSR
jgi:uncharacterized protein YciI